MRTSKSPVPRILYIPIVLYACEHIRMRSGRERVQDRVELDPTVADMYVDLC